MKVNFGQKCLRFVLGLALGSGVALAASIGVGSFSANSNLYWSGTTLDFGLNSQPPPGDQLASIAAGSIGVFAALPAGAEIAMSNLNLATANVTATTIGFGGTEPDWVSLPFVQVDLDLTDIPINTAVAICSGTPADDSLGAVCRPYASSPFLLHQTPNGVTFTSCLVGNAYSVGGSPTSGTPYYATVTGQLAGTEGTISQFIGRFDGAGYLSGSFSATFTTTAVSPVPEPGMAGSICVGLLLIGLVNERMRTGKRGT